MTWTAVTVLVAFAELAQSPPARRPSEFDAASVRRVSPAKATLAAGIDPLSPSGVSMGLPASRGGPGTSSPGRLHYTNVSLMYLMMKAFSLHMDQVRGPELLSLEKYNVDAVIPPGTTTEQFQQMLQNLIVKRFRPVIHWEERDFKVYHLSVAPGGPKLRSSAVADSDDEPDDPASLVAALKQAPLDESGCPILPLTHRASSGRTGGGNCTTFVGYSMSELATRLEEYVGTENTTADFAHVAPAHIVDDTALKGRFDFHFNYSPMYFLAKTAGFPMPAGLRDNFPRSDSIFKVVQAQLGLKLEAATSKLKVMLIQHIESDPGEN